MNKVILLGTMTREPELRYTQSGTAICKFGLAYNEKYKNAEKTHFFDFIAFGKTAENIQKYFHKGSRILVDGSLDFEQWTDQSGQKRSKVSVKVERFDFIDRARQQAQAQARYRQPAPQQTVPEVDIDSEEIPF